VKRNRARDGWPDAELKAEVLRRMGAYRVRLISADTLSKRIGGSFPQQVERVLVELRAEGLVRGSDAGWYLIEPTPAFGSLVEGGGRKRAPKLDPRQVSLFGEGR
jgi:hypothetical protein